jgi:endoglucanase
MFPRSILWLAILILLAGCVPAPIQPVSSPAVVGTAAASPPAAASDTPPAPTGTPVLPTPTPPNFSDAFAAARALGRGVNMGDALEAPNEGEWGVTIQQKYFSLIRKAGFNSVRIPVSWSAHAAAAAPYTIDPVFLTRVDTVTSWALDAGLVVILDFHNYAEMVANPGAHADRFVAIWDHLAKHYQKYSPAVFFELFNEPNTNMTAPLWSRLVKRTLGVVRQTNPERMVIFGGVSWNSYDQLDTLELPSGDTHLIATFHYYNPFHFTHQGAEWVDGSSAWMGTTWDATDFEKTEVNAQFDRVASWAKKNNIPILLGEFGAYSKADMAARVRWTSTIAREAERRGFAWAYWEFCAGFGVYDPVAETWRQPLLKALIP